MFRVCFAIVLATSVSACVASAGNVSPYGPGMHIATATGTSSPRASEKALGAANQYCAKSGRQIDVVRLHSQTAPANTGDAHVIFKCV